MSCGRKKSKKKGETRRRRPTTLVQSARENSIVRHSPQLAIRKKYEAISKFGRTEQQERKGNQRRRNTWIFFKKSLAYFGSAPLFPPFLFFSPLPENCVLSLGSVLVQRRRAEVRAAEGLFLSLPFLFLRDMANIRTRSLVEKKKEKEKVSSRNRKKAKKESSKSGCDVPKRGAPKITQ